MPIIAQKSQEEIRFILQGEICQSISNWRFTLDEMVFNEQLTTGSFRGTLRVDDDMDWMTAAQMAKAKGKIMPYYGLIGGSAPCIYTLRCNDSGYTLNVKNLVVEEEPLEFHDQATDKPGELTKPYDLLEINGKELRNLRSWVHWNESQAFTSRYVYHFGPVPPIGRLRHTICIDDIQSGEEIDVTDYHHW